MDNCFCREVNSRSRYNSKVVVLQYLHDVACQKLERYVRLCKSLKLCTKHCCSFFLDTVYGLSVATPPSLKNSLQDLHESYRCSGVHCPDTHVQLLHAQRPIGWLRSSVVRTSVSDRRTFPGLRSICSGCVTTYVSISSAIGQPTRPTQPFILPGSINE